MLMEAAVSAEIGAGRGEVSAARLTYRNGYRPCGWETRVGEIELAIPRKRSGGGLLPLVSGAAAALGAGDRGAHARAVPVGVDDEPWADFRGE